MYLKVPHGTEAGTKLVKDTFPGPGGTFSGIYPLGNSVITSLKDVAHGIELWTSQGTPETTALITDLNPGSADGTGLGEQSFYTAMGQIVGGSTGALAQCVIGTQNKIVFTDGTAANTRIITDAGDASRTQDSNVGFVGAIGSKALFTADDGVIGSELYVSDGTVAGTALLKNINTSGHSNPQTFQFFEDGKKAVFYAFTPETGV